MATLPPPPIGYDPNEHDHPVVPPPTPGGNQADPAMLQYVIYALAIVGIAYIKRAEIVVWLSNFW